VTCDFCLRLTHVTSARAAHVPPLCAGCASRPRPNATDQKRSHSAVFSALMAVEAELASADAAGDSFSPATGYRTATPPANLALVLRLKDCSALRKAHLLWLSGHWRYKSEVWRRRGAGHRGSAATAAAAAAVSAPPLTTRALAAAAGGAAQQQQRAAPPQQAAAPAGHHLAQQYQRQAAPQHPSFLAPPLINQLVPPPPLVAGPAPPGDAATMVDCWLRPEVLASAALLSGGAARAATLAALPSLMGNGGDMARAAAALPFLSALSIRAVRASAARAATHAARWARCHAAVVAFGAERRSAGGGAQLAWLALAQAARRDGAQRDDHPARETERELAEAVAACAEAVRQHTLCRQIRCAAAAGGALIHNCFALQCALTRLCLPQRRGAGLAAGCVAGRIVRAPGSLPPVRRSAVLTPHVGRRLSFSAVAKSLEAMTKAQTLAQQFKHSPVAAFADALQRVLELLLMFASLTTAQLNARADWMEAAAAAVGVPGGLPVPDAAEYAAAAGGDGGAHQAAPALLREPGCAEVALRQALVARAAMNAANAAAAAPAGDAGNTA